MRLEPVNPPRGDVRVLCRRCGSWEDSSRAWADLDGKPFADFYCHDCYAFAPTLEPLSARPRDAELPMEGDSHGYDASKRPF